MMPDLHFQMHAAAEGEEDAGDDCVRVAHKRSQVPHVSPDITFPIATHGIGDAQC